MKAPAARRCTSDLLVRLCILSCAWAPLVAAGATPPAASTTALEHELELLADLDRIPLFRSGSRVEAATSFDRSGGNDDGFSRDVRHLQREGDGLVLLDVVGSGVVQRIWAPDPPGAKLEFYFDGERSPRLAMPFRQLFAGTEFPFVPPLVGSELGGSFSYVPIPFAASLRIVYRGSSLGFYQIQYRLDSTPRESFRSDWNVAERHALARVRDSWARRSWPAELDEVGSPRLVRLAAGGEQEIYRSDRPGRIVGIELWPAAVLRGAGQSWVLRAQWDDDGGPAIEVPLVDLFGFAFGEPAAASALLGVDGEVAYFRLPMPFDRRATLTLVDRGQPLGKSDHESAFFVRIATTPHGRQPDEGRLYAVWRRESPAAGRDFEVARATGRGHLVGLLLQAQGKEPGSLEFFEGDDRVSLDGELRIHGTGTEDLFNGGWYGELDLWDKAISLPLHGSTAYNEPMSRTGGYRFFLADRLSFERSLRFDLEHGGSGNQAAADYRSLALIYAEVPPEKGTSPTLESLAPPQLPAFRFSGALLKLAIDRGASASRRADGTLVASTSQAARLRFELGDLPAGRYRLLVSYTQHPRGGEFSLWQRKRQVTPWIVSRGELREIDEEADQALEVDTGSATVTLLLRARDGANEVWIRSLTLTPMSAEPR